MTDAAAKHPADQAPPPRRRKPYLRPRLQEFGKLHLKTQGDSGAKGDGSNTFQPGMMGPP